MRNRQTDRQTDYYYGAAAPPGGRDLPGRILARVDVVPRMGGNPPKLPTNVDFRYLSPLASLGDWINMYLPIIELVGPTLEPFGPKTAKLELLKNNV